MTGEPDRKPSHQLSAFEERALMRARHEERDHPVPRFSVAKEGDGVAVITTQHHNEKAAIAVQAAALGTTHPDFSDTILNQVLNITGVDEKKFNGLVQAIAGFRPQDHVEAMLATQMATLHVATMDQARRMLHGTSPEARDVAERAMNRLARTFTAQVEALKRYRSNAEQRITVQHVQVNDGGQAIVGTVNTGGSSPEKTETTP